MRKACTIILLITITLLTACNSGQVYNGCCDVDENGWHCDSMATFTPQINDTVSRFNVLLTVRHTSEYQYQNFWMFVKVTSPEGLTATDTIECYLADNRGHFIGRGISVYEMPVLISQNLKFDSEGEYRFDVAQGMRDTLLTGIRNICLTIEKK